VYTSRTVVTGLLGALLLASCGVTGGSHTYQSAEEATAAEEWERASRLWYDINLHEEIKTERSYLEAARAFYKNGDTEGACALLRRGLMDLPRAAELYHLYSVILEDCGYSRKAERTYEHLLEVSPDHLEGLIGLGRVRMELGLERAAAGPLRRASQLSPESVEPCVHLARVHQVIGDPVSAYNWYARAIELGADDPFFLLDAGSLATGEESVSELPGVHEKALAWLERTIVKVPQVTKAHYLRAVNLQALGREDEAIESYLRAVETDPGCLPGLIRLAELFAIRGDDVRSAEFVERALEIEQDIARRETLRSLLERPPLGGG
jgi:tetratricopeptide (TPR) repeat protein